VLLETGLEVEVLGLPAGYDPDSYISEFGPEKFRQELGNARPFVESYIMNAVSAGDLSTPAGKMEVVNHVLPILTRVRNSVERIEWLRVLTERAAVNDKALLAELKNALRQDRAKLRPVQKTAEQRKKQNPELYLVHLMLADKKSAIKIKNQVSAEEFEDPALRQIIELFYNLMDKNLELRVDHAIDRIDEPEAKAILSRIGVDPIPFDNLERTANDCIHSVKKRLLDQKIITLKHQRNEAVAAGKPERSRELESQLRELRSMLISG
jgi:DNA primase